MLKIKNDSKIVMLVADGLGGLPLDAGRTDRAGNRQDAESRRTGQARASRAAASRSSRASRPAAARATSGLFGYDPLKYLIGRGVLEATGIGFHVGPERRGHPLQLLHARRHGQDHRPPRRPHPQRGERRRWPSSSAQVKIPGVEVFVEPVKEHRFVVVFRGAGLGGNVDDTDPQKTGVPPLAPVAARRGRARRPPRSPPSSSPRPRSSWPASRRPTA